MKQLFLGSLLFITQHFPGQSPSSHIHVDQFGYLPEMNKVAVISDPMTGFNASDSYSPGPQLELRVAATGVTVYSSAPEQWSGGDEHDQSGDRGWWFDFSAVDQEGEYVVHDPSTGQSSAVFAIHDDVYSEVMTAATRMFYYNRCNSVKLDIHAGAAWSDGLDFADPLQDPDCHYVYDQNNPQLSKDLSGGWYDAGDYNKYVTFAESVIHDLLWAYRENPGAFTDETNIPESGNGIPDILDEVKWELEWLMKMNNADGSTHIKMGSISFSENVSAPPSANSDPRYYGPTCTAASLSVASMFADAALVYQEVPGMEPFAQELLNRALASWDYSQDFILNGTLETDCDDGTILAGDADRSVDAQLESALIAAIYLFEATGENDHAQYIIDHLDDAEPVSVGFWGPYKTNLQDALLHYATFDGADPSSASTILNSFQNEVSNDWNGYFGFSEADLYRAQIPDWSYHWGSNQAKASYGVVNLQAINADITPDINSALAQKAGEQLHYFHGVNPLGLVQLSNMYGQGAERCVNEIYHTWFYDGTMWDHALDSEYGPPPGFLTGGANGNFSVAGLSPPYGQPLQKSYLDYNTGWPDNSWEISEPAIYYQAAYVRLLANFVDNGNICPGDLNADGAIDVNDFLMLSSSFGMICSSCPEDITGDGQVNINDFILFNSLFGLPCD